MFSKTLQRGALSTLFYLPLEILHEICKHLPPRDLVRLVRLSRSMHTFLMSRHARYVWRTALTAVPGLPPCPSWLIEPHYARLAFEPVCALCPKRVEYVKWTLGFRACYMCLRKNSEEIVVLGKPVVRSKIIPLVYVRWDVSHTSIIHVKRLNREYDQRRKAADPDVPVACINKELVEKWRTECGEVTDWASKCDAWYKLCKAEQRREQAAMCRRRRAAIVSGVRARGYGPELDYLDTLPRSHENRRAFNKKCSKARGADPAGWVSIEESLSVYLDTIRSAQRAAKLYPWLCQWTAAVGNALTLTKKQLGYDLPFQPTVAEVCCIGNMPALLLAVGDNLALVNDSTSKSMADRVAKELPGLLVQWSDRTMRLLFDLIPHFNAGHEDRPNFNRDSAVLSLASSWFVCHACANHSPNDTVHHAYAMMAHHCPHGRPWSKDCHLSGIPFELVAHFTSCGLTMPWTLPQNGRLRVSFSVEASRAARAITELCRLDPETATVQDLGVYNATFVCTGCTSEDSKGMSWQKAVNHVVESKFVCLELLFITSKSPSAGALPQISFWDDLTR